MADAGAGAGDRGDVAARTLTAELSIARGELAIDVALTCAPGITCVLGPSGAGKSSILGALAGLVDSPRGRIAIGADVWLDRARGIDVPVHRRQLAYVFQHLALFPHMTVHANVAYGLRDRAPVERAATAHAWLERVGVTALAARRPRTLSGGEAQRVALARALARAPKLILLDEPFSALDRALRLQLGTLVRELVTELGVPALYVTHSAAEARALGDRAIVIERGRIVAAGAVADVVTADA